MASIWLGLNVSKPEENGCYFADNISKYIFLEFYFDDPIISK